MKCPNKNDLCPHASATCVRDRECDTTQRQSHHINNRRTIVRGMSTDGSFVDSNKSPERSWCPLFEVGDKQEERQRSLCVRAINSRHVAAATRASICSTGRAGARPPPSYTEACVMPNSGANARTSMLTLRFAAAATGR